MYIVVIGIECQIGTVCGGLSRGVLYMEVISMECQGGITHGGYKYGVSGRT